MLLQRLKTEHRQILRIMERVETTLLPADAAEVVQIGEARWETQFILRENFAFKDAFVFSVLASSGRPKAVLTARRLQALGSKIRDGYRRHVERWDPSRMATDWDAYRAASLEMIDQLRELIEVEKRDLYPILKSEVATTRALKPPLFGHRVRATA